MSRRKASGARRAGGARKVIAGSSRAQAGELSADSLADLKKKAKTDPYGVLHECARRAAAGGPVGATLKQLTLHVLDGIEARLMTGAGDTEEGEGDRDTMIQHAMEFGSELGVEIHIDDEAEEGIVQAMGALEKLRAKYEALRAADDSAGDSSRRPAPGGAPAPAGDEIAKGARISIIKGKDAGVKGTVFWAGDSKFGKGKRYGLKDDEGTTYWADEWAVKPVE